MKKIHLIRHAKSSWKDASLADIDRPLNKRGIKACDLMARAILDAGCNFKHVYCSTAVRAQSTITLIDHSLSDIKVSWQLTDELYTFDSKQLYKWFRLLDDSIQEVVIIGHNPALTDFCNKLSNSYIENIPTCGYVQLNAKAHSAWKDLSAGSFNLAEFITPKALAGE
ncbi:SixA phosphatase family protein [Sessilibacter corallicola]|uniref:SixA phosphatase family protein n=1 Tax=Sessilibacter corallicola TaxID=2904075 RepID=UPI001E3E1B5B|nr:histidine phosphatase family protein [Sessilibacter corallicola]MCE2030288.1 histidine phosphatase family protein [Sessilibacter corallicola]